jgi:glycosyltransferase involved in cell wall biosynthesis
MQISVIIPTYNRYELLKRALSSVQAQTYKPKEVIVVDDGSTDNTSQIKVILNSLEKLGINTKYIYQKNAGVSSARNTGIKHSTSSYVAFLDSDDEWHKNKLAKQTEYHKQNPDILLSYTDEIWLREKKEIKVPKKFQKIGDDIFRENLEYCNIAPSSVCLHVEILKEVGLFDEDLEVCEDYDLWLRILSRYKIGLIKEKLITKHAGHQNQLSFKHWGMDRFRLKSLQKVIHLYSGKKQQHIREVIVRKLHLLLKGAIKYGRIQDIKYYEDNLKLYE